MADEQKLTNVLSQCKVDTIIAFKDKESGEWFSGKIQFLYEPHSRYNDTDKYSVEIAVNMPVEPQWYEKTDKTVFEYKDLLDAVILENGKAEA